MKGDMMAVTQMIHRWVAALLFPTVSLVAGVPNDMNHDGVPDLLIEEIDGKMIYGMEVNVGYGVVACHPIGKRKSSTWKVYGEPIDLDGDHNLDILLREEKTGAISVMKMLSFHKKKYIPLAKPGSVWKIVGISDINGDGYQDIVIQNSKTGLIKAIKTKANCHFDSYKKIGSSGGTKWQVVAVKDIDNDKIDDILLRNNKDGSLKAFKMKKNFTYSKKNIGGVGGAIWLVTEVSDIDNDKIADILLQNRKDGSLKAFKMKKNFGHILKKIGKSGGASWRVKDLVDINGDKIADIVLQNEKTGIVKIFKMKKNFKFTSKTVFKPEKNIWYIRRIQDMNRDGIRDLVVQSKTTGDIVDYSLDENFNSDEAWRCSRGANWEMVSKIKYKTLPPLPPSNEGRNFHLAFMENYQDSNPLNLRLYISSKENTDVTIKYYDTNQTQKIHINAYDIKEVNVSKELEQQGTGISNKMIEVSSKKNIVVVGLNRKIYTTDAYLGLPDQLLGKEYYAATYTKSSWPEEISVIATENNTEITLELPTPVTVTLNKGEVYQYMGDDLTGIRVRGNRNFAMLSGSQCANIPNGYYYCDHIVEEMPPVDTWEKEFITVPLATRTKGDTFRIVAAQDGTEIQMDGELVATLNSGEYYETVLQESTYIKSNYPVMVLQYSNGTTYDSVTSDPFMTLVPAIKQFDTAHIIQTPLGFTNYINIVVKATDTEKITLDGQRLDPTLFNEVPGNSSYAYAQIPIREGTHKLYSKTPIGLVGYGFAKDDSYGYPSSLKLIKH
jgi:hypothetical protein